MSAASRWRARQIIAGALVSLLAIALTGLIVTAIAARLWSPTALADRDWVELTREFLAVLLVPLIGLVGAILGFYYHRDGSARKSQS